MLRAMRGVVPAGVIASLLTISSAHGKGKLGHDTQFSDLISREVAGYSLLFEHGGGLDTRHKGRLDQLLGGRAQFVMLQSCVEERRSEMSGYVRGGIRVRVRSGGSNSSLDNFLCQSVLCKQGETFAPIPILELYLERTLHPGAPLSEILSLILGRISEEKVENSVQSAEELRPQNGKDQKRRIGGESCDCPL